jgi:DNA-binding beta-propeller fold protein YncE
MKKRFKSMLLFVYGIYTTTLFSGITAYYGDRTLQRTVIIDVDNMTMIDDIVTNGEGHYSVNQAGHLPKVYVDTRKSDFLEIIDTVSNTFVGRINLQHHPRSSEAYNDTLGLQLVPGSDKPMLSVIDVRNDSVVAVVGDNTVYPPNGDYGGGNATGHSLWLTKNKFILIDRPNRTIKVFKIWKNKRNEWKTKLLSKSHTATAVHHFLKGKQKHIFYALAEGSQNANISPHVIKYKLTKKGKLIKKKIVYLSKGVNTANMGAHHMDMHPSEKILYVGSTEGLLYVINLKKMKVIGTIPAGKGAGHVTFAPQKNLAIVTNHKDTYITVFDTQTHTFIKNITVSGPSQNGAILQSHTSYVSDDGRYFYSFATDNGIFYRVNLDTLAVEETLDTGGTPLQGVFIETTSEDEIY